MSVFLTLLFAISVCKLVMLIPGAFQVVSFVFGFFLSIVTLVTVYHVIIYSYKTLVQFNWQLAFETHSGFVLAVLKMAAICFFFRYFEFIITQFMTLLITFFHVIIHSYETLVQLDWQLAFETLSGYVLAVFKMAAACVSVVFHCFEFIITQFMTLLITLVSIIWKIASFVFILSWHITLKIVETLGHVFNFFVSNATLMIRSVSHVTIRSYETVVQLDWQLAFETLSGFVLAVFKMAATCVSVVFRCFEFIITQFMTLLITLVSIIWKIASFVFILSWHITLKIVETLGHVFNFFVSNATLMIRSVSHVTIRSYETVVQLDWQLAFETLSGFVLAVFKMAATCVSVVFRCFEFIITQFMTLLITLVSIIWKIASFVFIHTWHITVKIVETFVSLVVGISELISAVIDSTMSSNPLNTIAVIFCTVSIVIVSLLLMKSVPFRKIYRCLAHKFQELTRNAANPEQRSSTVRGDNVRPDAAAMVQRNDRSADLTIRHRHPNLEQSKKEVEKELYTTKKLLDEEKATKLCTVCLDNPRTMFVRPCKHYCLCERCLEKLTTRKCPICNSRIECVEKIYDV